MDDRLKKSTIKEYCYFLDGTSGNATLKQKPQISAEQKAYSSPTMS